MSGFLLDTNVLSEYNRPGGPNAGVKRWLQLEQWLKQDLEEWLCGRILPVDRQVADRWASLVAQTPRSGRSLPTIDSQIAATALAHKLKIVTRNTRDFEGIGAMTINPWEVSV